MENTQDQEHAIVNPPEDADRWHSDPMDMGIIGDDTKGQLDWAYRTGGNKNRYIRCPLRLVIVLCVAVICVILLLMISLIIVSVAASNCQ